MVYLAELQVCITVCIRIVIICALVQFLVLNSLRKRVASNATFQLS